MASFDPTGGGPIEGVRQMAARLLKLGHVVEIVTMDDPKQSFLDDVPLKIYALGPSQGRYRYNGKLVPWLKTHVDGYDAVIVNGIWNYHSFGSWRALRSTGVPYFVFTHGMLDPWFKHTYPLKHIKKWLYWPWAEYRVLRDAQGVLFTSEDERLLARQSFWLYRAKERVVKYGTTSPPQDAERLRECFLASHSELRDRRVLLFLGRIHEKKGCDLLIQAFAVCAHADRSLHLVMAGPDQTGWALQLKDLAYHLGVADRITWTGMVSGDLKWGALRAAEAFVLPSHQENFGIAVAEALGCGLPVLISDKVNIWREIEAERAGIVASDNYAGTLQLLTRWLAMPNVERQTMGVRARQLFRRRFTIEAMAESVLGTIKEHEDNSVRATD